MTANGVTAEQLLATMQAQLAEMQTAMRSTLDRVSQLETTNTSLQSQLQSSNVALIQAQSAFMSQQAKLDEMASKASSDKPKLLDISKLLPKPPVFKGLKEEWEPWKFAFTTWLASVHGKLPKIMDESAAEKNPIREEDMDEDTANFAPELFALLLGYLDGPPAILAKGIENRNGFEFWPMLHVQYQPQARGKALV
jgi:hypothetical protein